MGIFKIVFLFCLIFTFGFTAYSQEKSSESEQGNLKTENAKNAEIDSVFGHFIMVNSADSSKYFKLKDVGSYRLGYVEIPKDTVTLNKIYDVTGNIRELNKTSLDFDVLSEAIEHNFKDSTTINTQIDYSSFYYSKLETPRQINLKNLRYVDYSSPLRNVVRSSGLSIMIVGAFTALVLAPAFSIDYQNNDMDVKSYLTIAKVGLVGVAAGFPIYKFSKTKRYNVTNNKKKNDRDFWYLVKEDE